jgi:integrase
MVVYSDMSLDKYLSGVMLQIYLIGCATGLRVIDIINLKVRHLRPAQPTVKEIKTGKSKRIRIPAKVRRALMRQYRDAPPDAWLFPSPHDRTNHISRQAVYKALRVAERESGNNIPVGTHTMRKNYATKLYNKGASIKEIQAKLNHKSYADTLRYLMPPRGTSK